MADGSIIIDVDLNSSAYEQGLSSIESSAESTGQSIQATAQKIGKIVETVAAAAVLKVGQAILSIGASAAEAAISFESAFAGVEKTVDATAQQLKVLSDGIRQMALETPAAVEEIAAVAEAAGQLGIATGDILSFTQVMIDLGVATNMSANEAATAIARIANITGLAASEYSNFASTIVELGNNMATTESEIVAMANRLASTASIVGLSNQQMLAFAATLSSLGIEAEAGGTAMSKLLKEIQTAVELGGAGLQQFAQVAGMSAEQFAIAWGENAPQAIMAFLEGLNNVEANGRSAIAVLDEMGITEVRMSNAILAMANNTDLLSSALDTSNRAFEENIALSTEAQKRYATTESKLKLLANATNDLGITMGNLLTPAIGAVVDALTGAVNGINSFLKANEGLGKLIMALVTGLGTFVVVLGGAVLAINAVSTALKALGALIVAHPYLALIAAVAGLAVAIGTLTASADNAVPSVQSLTEASREAAAAVEESGKACESTIASIQAAEMVAQSYISQLEALEAAGLNSAQAQMEYKTAVDMLNATIPGLNAKINEQTGLVEGGTNALRQQIAALTELAIAQATYEHLETAVKNYANAQIEAAKNTVLAKQALAEMDSIQQQLYATSERLIKVQSDIAAEYEKHGENAEALSDTLVGLRDEEASLTEQTLSLGVELQECSTKLNVYNAAVKDGEIVLQGLEGEITLTKEMMSELGISIDDVTSKTDDATDATDQFSNALGNASDAASVMAANVGAALAAVGVSIDEFQSGVSELVDASTDMFSRIDVQSGISLNKMKENLIKNGETVREYGNNMSALAERIKGLEFAEEFLAELSEMGVGGAAILAELVSSSDSQLQELVGIYGSNATEAVGAYLLALGIAPSGSTAILGELLAGTSAGIEKLIGVWAEGGAQAAYMYLVSIGVAPEQASAIVGQLAEIMSTTGTQAAEGIRGSTPEVASAAETMADGAKQPLADVPAQAYTEGINSGVSFGLGIGDANAYTVSVAVQLASDVVIALEGAVGPASSAGMAVGQGFASGIESMTGAVASAAAALAAAANKAFKDKLDINSPSKVTERYGQWYGEGFAIGVDDSKQGVNASIVDLADEANRKAYQTLRNAVSSEMGRHYQIAAANSRSGSSVVNNTTHTEHGMVVNFNQPTQSPAQAAKAMRNAVKEMLYA